MRHSAVKHFLKQCLVHHISTTNFEFWILNLPFFSRILMVYFFWKVELDWDQNSTCLFKKKINLRTLKMKETIFSEKTCLVDSGLVVDIWWTRYKWTAHQMVSRKNEFRISTIWIKNRIVAATRKTTKNERRKLILIGWSFLENSEFMFSFFVKQCWVSSTKMTISLEIINKWSLKSTFLVLRIILPRY